MKKTILYSLFYIFLVIILDQITKSGLMYMLIHNVPISGDAWQIIPGPYMVSRVTNFFNIVFTWNPGTSFSMFRSLGEAAPMIIVIGTGFIIGFLAHNLFFRTSEKIERIALSLIIGGALGNLIDRIRFGAVIDFLDFHIDKLHWPAFNVADVCISVGVILYILSLFIKRKK